MRSKRFILAFFPPDFVSRWDSIVDGILESIWMAVTSTVIGIILSIPVGLGAVAVPVALHFPASRTENPALGNGHLDVVNPVVRVKLGRRVKLVTVP